MSLAIEGDAGPAAHGLLRQACAPAHAALDAKAARFDLTDRASYTEMLARMSGPVGALEDALAAGAWPRLFPDFQRRQRSAALYEDLKALGGVFRSTAIDPIEDEAAALGVLYVLEGSRLGARVLARQVEASGDPVVKASTRFLRHEEGAGHWRSFIITLNASAAVEKHPQKAIKSALAAFKLFDEAL